jgi:outer membrane protein insertion porin family
MRLTTLLCLCGLAAAQAQPKPIEGIELQGLSSVSQDTVKALISGKAGDTYDEEALRRDVAALWKTGRFDDIQLRTEPGTHGGVLVRFVLTERAKAIEGIEFRGAKSVSVDTLKATIQSKAGGVYDQEALRRDFTALWKTGRFDDIKLDTAPGERGGVIVRFVLTERP